MRPALLMAHGQWLMPYVDLHVHTSYSDGRLPPRAVVEAAVARSLVAIAITDHDVVDGLAEAVDAGRELGVEVVPGIELTADWDGHQIHLLGYFIDPSSRPLHVALDRARRLMAAHVDGVLERLGSLGHPIERSDLEKYRSRYPGGAGLVLAMLQRGTLRKVPQAAELLRLASREPRAFDASQAVAVIHQAGGLASLAHPVRIRRDKPLLDRHDLAPLVKAGLDGVEVWQIVHRAEAREHYGRLAETLGLLPTGGSDCHGPSRGVMRLGSQHVPESVLTRLREALEARPPLPAAAPGRR